MERQDDIAAAEGQVLLVAYDEASLLQAKMLRGIESPFPILFDPKKAAYRAWGMGRTTPLRSFLSPRLSWRYLKLLVRGERFLGLAPDMLQLGGDFVVAPDGRLAFAHPMRDNGDRADPAVVVEALLACAGGKTLPRPQPE
jgi:hypothetical protein